MEKHILQLEIADYRMFLTHYDRSRIRKIEVAAPDIAALLPLLRDEMARIARPDTILLTVGVPSADEILYSDMLSLLGCLADKDNNRPSVCWGIREHTDALAVRVVAYVGISKGTNSSK